jgi:hypothetical protein
MSLLLFSSVTVSEIFLVLYSVDSELGRPWRLFTKQCSLSFAADTIGYVSALAQLNKPYINTFFI